jgi:hypothetical protein
MKKLIFVISLFSTILSSENNISGKKILYGGLAGATLAGVYSISEYIIETTKKKDKNYKQNIETVLLSMTEGAIRGMLVVFFTHFIKKIPDRKIFQRK